MKDALLVTQFARSLGEFRRPWVRALHRRYVARYRRLVVQAARDLGESHQVTVLGSRELIDAKSMPSGTRVRFFEDESYSVEGDDVIRVTRKLASAWWDAPETDPDLTYRDVWLPGVVGTQRAIVMRLEVVEPFAVVRKVVEETTPERIVRVTGHSVPERLAAAVARTRGIATSLAVPAAPTAHLHALSLAWLLRRDERRRRRLLSTFHRRPRPFAGAPGPERFLFVTCRPRHHYLVDPLVAAVRAAGAEAHVVAFPNDHPEMTARLEVLGRAGVPWSYATDELSREEARRLSERHGPGFRALARRRVSGSDPLTIDGVDLTDVARPILAETIRTALPAALVFQEAAFRSLERIHPSAVVITSNRRYPERAMAEAARIRGIPCVLFSGTLLVGRDPTHDFDLGDRVLVMGEHARDELVARGVRRPVAVVGDPRSNAARLVPPAELRAEVERDFALARGRPLLVLISKYVSLLFAADEKAALYRTVIDAVPKLPSPNVIVKVHPNEDLELLRSQVSEWGWPDAILTQDYDIHRLFGAADLAIMVTSMAGLEAMAMGCPVVAAQTRGKDFEGHGMPAYVSEGAAARVDLGDVGGLVSVVRTLLEPGDVRTAAIERGRTFAARYVHPVDGALVERLRQVIADVRREFRIALSKKGSPRTDSPGTDFR